MKIEDITNSKEIAKALPRVIELIKLSYEVYYGTLDEKKLTKNTSLIQVVRAKNGEIISAALCRMIEGSHKIQAICSDRSPEGKEGIKEIIKRNIVFYKNWVWGEVSEAIEHYYKKFDGYPIPNCFAAELLEKAPEKIQLDQDGFHYYRSIGKSEPLRKVIYGFRDQKTLDKVLKTIDYQEMRKKFNLSESVLESEEYPKDLKYSSSFVNQLSDLFDEGEITELTPTLSAVLDSSIRTLKKHIGQFSWVEKTYEFAKFLKEDIPQMKLGTFNATIEKLN